MKPADIMRQFPVGRILEIQSKTKERITFFHEVMSSIDLVQNMFVEKFGDRMEPVAHSELNEAVESLLEAQPLQAMLSIALSGGWSGPEAIVQANQSASTIRRIIWSMVYADIVQDYAINRSTWLKLKLSLLEKPLFGGILVRGYEFTEEELGHMKSSSGAPDICPDYPPENLFNNDDAP